MIASGKGGTGKSTLAVHLGGRLAALGKRVLLIELDSGLRSVDLIAGVCGKTVYDLEDIFSGRCEADKAVVESPAFPGLFLISAPYSGGSIRPERLRLLTGRMNGSFDFILLDTAAGLGDAFTAALGAANGALVVINPDPVTARDGRIVADSLFDAGLTNVRLVINRAADKNPIRDLDECIDTVGAQLIGVVPESAALAAAAAEGRPLTGNGICAAALENIARRLLGQQVPLAVR